MQRYKTVVQNQWEAATASLQMVFLEDSAIRLNEIEVSVGTCMKILITKCAICSFSEQSRVRKRHHAGIAQTQNAMGINSLIKSHARIWFLWIARKNAPSGKFGTAAVAEMWWQELQLSSINLPTNMCKWCNISDQQDNWKLHFIDSIAQQMWWGIGLANDCKIVQAKSVAYVWFEPRLPPCLFSPSDIDTVASGAARS